MKNLLILIAAFAGGCSSSVALRDLNLAKSPPAPPANVEVRVDKSRNNEQGEAIALENGLKRAIENAGYQSLAGDVVLKAEIVELHRGSTVANVMIGLGVGGDYADVKVGVEDSSGAPLLSFVVRGSVHDKRYRELHEVLSRWVADRIVQELAHPGEAPEAPAPRRK